MSATIQNPNNLESQVTGMNANGEYVFRLTATDSNGNTSSDEITITKEDGLIGNLVLPDGYVLGDSISNTSSNPRVWHYRYLDQYGVNFNNISNGGRGIKWEISEYNKLGVSTLDFNIYLFSGLNNLRIPSVSQLNINTVVLSYRSILAYYFCKSTLFAYDLGSNIQFTRSYSGSTTDTLAGSLSQLTDNCSFARKPQVDTGRQTNIALFSNTSIGDYITFSSANAGAISGSKIVIGTVASSSNDYSRLRIYVDGVDKGVYDPQNKIDGQADGTNSGISFDCIIIDGLVNQPHEVKIEFLDNGKVSMIDYIGEIGVSSDFPDDRKAFVFEIPLLSDEPNVGYNYPGYITNRQNLIDATQQIKDVVDNDFAGLPIVKVEFNSPSYYDVENQPSQVGSDGIHPNDIGQELIKECFYDSYQ